MRKIVLELAEDTTETHCGSCRWYEDARCGQWNLVAYNERRVPECIAAERTFSRLLDVSPEDAAGTIVACALTSDSPSWPDGRGAAKRISDALRSHAKKAEVK